MEPNTILLIIILARIFMIHSIVSAYLQLKNIVSVGIRVVYLFSAGAYLYYISLHTVTSIPHTIHDLVRVLSVATLFYIVSKYIRRTNE